MKEWIKENKLYLGIFLLALLLIAYYFFSPPPAAKNPVIESPLEDMHELEAKSEQPAQSEQPKEVKKMMVDIKGAVQKPGVYFAFEGERIVDLIERAGGLLEKADETKINLAMYVEDEMVLYVPAIGEDSSLAPELEGGGGQNSSKEGKVNINKAMEAELETLPGIGPSKSAAIIEYRESMGGFKTIDDLQSISGIGAKTFEKLKDKITVD